MFLQTIFRKVGKAMSKSLSSFMMMAAIVVIMVSLIFGIVYSALEEKNKVHEEMLRNEHQIKFK